MQKHFLPHRSQTQTWRSTNRVMQSSFWALARKQSIFPRLVRLIQFKESRFRLTRLIPSFSGIAEALGNVHAGSVYAIAEAEIVRFPWKYFIAWHVCCKWEFFPVANRWGRCFAWCRRLHRRCREKRKEWSATVHLVVCCLGNALPSYQNRSILVRRSVKATCQYVCLSWKDYV